MSGLKSALGVGQKNEFIGSGDYMELTSQLTNADRNIQSALNASKNAAALIKKANDAVMKLESRMKAPEADQKQVAAALDVIKSIKAAVAELSSALKG